MEERFLFDRVGLQGGHITPRHAQFPPSIEIAPDKFRACLRGLNSDVHRQNSAQIHPAGARREFPRLSIDPVYLPMWTSASPATQTGQRASE